MQKYKPPSKIKFCLLWYVNKSERLMVIWFTEFEKRCLSEIVKKRKKERKKTALVCNENICISINRWEIHLESHSVAIFIYRWAQKIKTKPTKWKHAKLTMTNCEISPFSHINNCLYPVFPVSIYIYFQWNVEVLKTKVLSKHWTHTQI